MASGSRAASSLDAARGALFAFVGFFLAATLAAIELAIRRQLHVFGVEREGVVAAAALGAIGVAVAGGLWALWTPRDPRRVFAWALFAASLAVGAATFAPYVAFPRGEWVAAAIFAGPVAVGATLGVVVVSAGRAIGKTCVALGMVEHLVAPFRLAALTLALGLGAAAGAQVGLLKSGLAVALALAVSAYSAPLVIERVERVAFPGARAVRRSSLGAFGFGVALVAASERVVPIVAIHSFPTEVVFVETTDRASFVVTSGQDAYELHVDGELFVSTIDAARFHEALVLPALAAAPKRSRVLLLGTGTGLAEREALRFADVNEVVTVVVDDDVARISRELSWLDELAQGALRSPKLRIIEDEPMAWLAEAHEIFDVAIVNLPDPNGFEQGKNFTRYFFRLLSNRLAPHGVAVVQAASPFDSPRTFAGVGETIRAAGLVATPYRTPVPTFGEWGFHLVSRAPLAHPTALPPDTSFLTPPVLDALFVQPRDITTTAPTLVTTLPNQSIVETFAEEREAIGR